MAYANCGFTSGQGIGFFARHGQTAVILWCGGEKQSQDSDIKRAKRYWNDYQTRTKNPAARPERR